MNTSTAVAHRAREASFAIREFLEARTPEIAKALPPQIRPEHFVRVALTAVSNNPDLLGVDLRSLWNALLKCAADGLIPDGREAALVAYGKNAGYIRMTGGIRKLVFQSGAVTRFEQTIVYANDKFSIRFGDRPHIHHEPINLNERGDPIAVYSVAQFKDGTLSREIMTIEEIEKVRAVSRAANSGPWKTWWEEMARKTVARRHSKVLPMSSDAAAALEAEREAEFDDAELDPSPAGKSAVLPPARRPHLAETLDTLASSPGPGAQIAAEASKPQAKRGRGRHVPCTQCGTMRATGEPCPNCGFMPMPGRPPKRQPVPTDAEIEQSQARIGNVLGEPSAPAPDELEQTDRETDEPPEPPPDPRDEPDYDGPPERIENVREISAPEPPPAKPPPDPDYECGWRDARAGYKACLNTAIRDEPRRHARWQAGHDAFHRQRDQQEAP